MYRVRIVDVVSAAGHHEVMQLLGEVPGEPGGLATVTGNATQRVMLYRVRTVDVVSAAGHHHVMQLLVEVPVEPGALPPSLLTRPSG